MIVWISFLREVRFFYVPQWTDGSAIKTEIVMKRDATHRRGQGLVEFALVVPLFLVLLFGMIEFGRAWMTKNILTGAAREAVRNTRDPTTMLWQNTAVNIVSSAGLKLR
jgi:hypothetical protein